MIALPISCPVFIGRLAELEALNDARRDLGKSRGSFVAIGGEAGVGKSRLVRAFLARSGDRRVRNLAATECLEGGTEPLRPVRSIIAGLLAGGLPAELSANARLALARIAPQLLDEASPAIAAQPIDRSELFAGIVDLLAACSAKRATIVIIEDLHWADPSTLDFLTYLAPRIAHLRLLVIGTHRSEELASQPALAAALARIERNPTARRIGLDPFGSGDVRDFIIAALDGRAADEDVITDIAARSEGNAFFAEELLKDALTYRRSNDARLPISIRGIIAERIGPFAPFSRRVLAFAAVLGLRFDPALLAEIMMCPIADLIAPLQHARDAALLVEDDQQPGRLRFRHALTRQVIVEDLLAFDARGLHRRILETLEAQASPDLFALAEHAAAAGDPERTLHYGERAGEAAWDLGCFSEAETCIERALAVANDDDARARLMKLLAFPVDYRGDSERALRLWDEAFAIRTRRGEFAEAARILVLLVCERFNLGQMTDDGAAALAFVDAHAGDLAPIQRDRLFILIACMRSEVVHMRSIDHLLSRIETPESALAPDIEQNVLVTRLNREAYYGRVGAWRGHYASLVALTPIHPKPSVDAVNVCDHLASLITSAVHLDVNAELDEALARGRQLAATWGLTRYATTFHALKSSYAFARGRLEDARAAFFAAAGERGESEPAVLARTAPLLALALGDDAFVARTISPGLIARERAAIRAQPDSDYARLLLGGYAVWLVQRGRDGEALTFIAEALNGILHPSPRFATLVAFALRHLGPDRIPNLAVFAERHHLADDDRTAHATALLVNAACSGDADGLRNAAAAFSAVGFPLCAAHALYLAGDGEAASALYAACGATAYVRARATAPPARAIVPLLSQRELAVAEGVAGGLTNGAIAERLSLSKKSIEKYVASIFRKLDLRSRSQIAVRLRDLDLRP